MTEFVSALGGELIDLMLDPESAEASKHESSDFPSITLSQRQLCDLELLINGAFSPLTGFMGKKDYKSVVEGLHLADGTLWPMPVVLDVTDKFADGLRPGQKVALRDGEGFMPAVMTVDDIWQADKEQEAEYVYGTTSKDHPGVRYLYEKVNNVYIGGRVEGIQLSTHHDFENLWDSPRELRALFNKMGWRRVVAFQTSKPIHRVQRDVVLQAAKDIQGHVLLHPAVGMTRPGDIQYYARVHCYQAIQRYFPHHLSMLSLLPLAMRMAGPREALWHVLIHQNFGCSHMIIGPKHAYPPYVSERDSPFYSMDEARNFVLEYIDELQIKVVSVGTMHYVPEKKKNFPLAYIKDRDLKYMEYSDRRLKQDLLDDQEIPDWFSFPEVLYHLCRVYPPRNRQGFTLFFTGLSGAGKSTLAKIVYAKLVESGGRPVTLLDGDIVRLNLSSELGFSKKHRDLNVKRIGFVASEITKNRGIAICAPIAPYTNTRHAVREAIEQHGAFIEIYVSTPLKTCESRDRKGLYAKAREGLIPEFTGISDPYEVPDKAEINIDTSDYSAMEAAQEIYLYLLREGFLDKSDISCH